jgi:7-cyano-7-deazaguanine synthase
MNKKKEIAVSCPKRRIGQLRNCICSCKKYELALLHINYGQRTEARELKAFNDIADYYNVKKNL